MTLNLDTGLRRVLAVDAVTCVAAGLMAWLSRQAGVAPAMVWLIVLGNAAGVAGSLLVVVDLRLTLLGEVFVLGQGLAVAVLTVLEFNGLRRSAALSPV